MEFSLTALDSILACAVCVGNPDHAATWGMNMAIGLLLMIVAVVLGGFLAFIVYLGKKEREAAALEQAGAYDIGESEPADFYQ